MAQGQSISHNSSAIPLPTTECCDLVAITTSRHTAPPPAMIFGRIVEVEHARDVVGAATQIPQIRVSEEKSNLAGENGEDKLVSVQL